MILYARSFDVLERCLDQGIGTVVGGDITTYRDWGGKRSLLVPGVVDLLLRVRDAEHNDVKSYMPGNEEGSVAVYLNVMFLGEKKIHVGRLEEGIVL